MAIRKRRAKSKKRKKEQLKVSIGKLELKNPVIAASGTVGYGEEMAEFFDVSKLGAIVTKTITLKPRIGNPTPRIVETPSGMLNSIGLENKGLKDFIFNKTEILERLNIPVIVSISGNSVKEFSKLAEELSTSTPAAALELNLSCPNIKHNLQSAKYKLIAQDANATGKIVSAVREKTKLPVIAKLSPNVTNIREIAKTVEREGANAISAINTLFGLAIDVKTRRPKLAKGIGGLSGPAIKPVALNFVREIYNCVKIPVIGIGGIMTTLDALEFIICGATAVQIGTANFINPFASLNILEGLKRYVKENRIRDIMSLVGTIKI